MAERRHLVRTLDRTVARTIDAGLAGPKVPPSWLRQSSRRAIATARGESMADIMASSCDGGQGSDDWGRRSR